MGFVFKNTTQISNVADPVYYIENNTLNLRPFMLLFYRYDAYVSELNFISVINRTCYFTGPSFLHVATLVFKFFS